MKNNIEKAFKESYGHDCEAVFFAPARVNLIGEHIDYNGGLVMPCAITNGTYLAIRKVNDGKLKFKSLNFPDSSFEIGVNNKGYQKEKDYWINYPLGVIDYLTHQGVEIHGLEMLFYGNIPNGGGLSSSASIEVVTAYALNDFYDLQKSTIELVKISQNVENKFVGVNCGIMDQFSVGMGKKDNAIILDCQTLEYHYTPFQLKNETLLIINTNKERKLADSKYNERRSTCEQALEIFNKNGGGFKDLCSIPIVYFEENQSLLNEEMRKRVRHVVYENQRVKDSANALKNNDIVKFGELMKASHKSLMEDYEVTGKELDTVYLQSVDYDGVIGVRMTGAGFGGCAIAIVKNDKLESYKNHIEEVYTDIVGYAPAIYEAGIGNGVQKI